MEPRDERELAEVLSQAVATNDSALIRECMMHVSANSYDESLPLDSAFPEAVFSTIISLMSTGELLKIDEPEEVLLLFETEWSRLTEVQKEILLSAIKKYFDKFRGSDAYFVISELLGQFYCNAAALAALADLKNTQNVEARCFIPHGFEHIVRGSSSVELRQRARDHLTSMMNDESPEVRHEVSQSIAVIDKQEGGD